MNFSETIASSHLASAAILSALVAALQTKGLLSDDEVREVYEYALLMIENRQGESGMAEIYEAARELIEEHLRP